MRAVGQESKYCEWRGLRHPFATPRIPFILKLTRPLAETLRPGFPFACIYMPRCFKPIKYVRVLHGERIYIFFLRFNREPRAIHLRLIAH